MVRSPEAGPAACYDRGVTRSRLPPPPLADPARAVLGRTLGGRYVPRAIVGRGGMGVVYAADDLGDPTRRVALKLLPRMMRDPDSVARFEREIHAMRSAHHPSIVAMFDHGWLSTQEPWFAMELLDGSTLHDRIDRGPVPPPELAALLGPIADALDALHAAGAVHRDVKPGNVLFTDASWARAKLGDFGLALITESALPRLTDPGVIVGTPAYLPPESATTRQWTSAADVYALGILMFEALTGTLPFEGSTVDVLIAKRTRPAPALADAHPGPFAPGVERAIAHALASDPRARPARASDVVRALAAAA